ncbi:MAG: hypothetical protein NXI19_06210 [Alphaproteobacteria bacterium]|nr:hypothetical protein [Alphaproteobacteria bacterium]
MSSKSASAGPGRSGGTQTADSGESAGFESDEPKAAARPPAKASDADRANRRAEALRANLRRRKDQSRARRGNSD